MSESFELIVNHILAQNPSLPREQLLSLVEKKKQESHGLLSDEGAIRLVAQQMSLPAFPSQGLGDLRISSVQAGLSDVSIAGEILTINGLSEFQRSNGSPGKVLRLVLGDSSGKISCALWDSIAEHAVEQGLTRGSRVRFGHGYTRYGPGGETQYHLGQSGDIQPLEIRAAPVTVADLPPRTVADLDREGDEPNLGGGLRVRVRKLVSARTEKGPVQALCEDETGLVIVKFWDEAGGAVMGREGSVLLIQNARVLERNGLLYVNVGNSSVIGSYDSEVASAKPARIDKLQPSRLLTVLEGRVVERGEVREIETREGRKAKVSNVTVQSGTGKVRMSLWDKHAEFVETVRLGDMVKLTGVRVRKNYLGDIEASTVFLSQTEKLPRDMDSA